ncbi:molybdopterin-dependent oxidoreductase [uncultured Tateyamaria sp.]|uniref:molybdopterin-dependent oxidoreductase n=1 Tax=Tateyamaria sp. 1078 TaxID=3417464 RepID=UPI00262619F0|nr:molybdopterin-dependent oxidoreductase [uncultured Tateyamaria sp.]
MMLSRRLFAGVLSLAVALPLGVWASTSLPQPEGDVLLNVTGSITVGNTASGAAFDRKMLEALDWVEIETYTSFTTGPQRFSGPTLASVLAAVGATGTSLEAKAINDYAVRIPVSDADDHDVILAMDMNGKPMRVRDKGPIWVIYPLSRADAEMRPFDGQMIWQLVQIRVD